MRSLRKPCGRGRFVVIGYLPWGERLRESESGVGECDCDEYHPFRYCHGSWFDLVRQAMRNGQSKDIFTAVQGKYEGNTRSIEIKFNNPYGLFLPLNKEEIKINDKLKQNPAYQRTDEVIQKAK